MLLYSTVAAALWALQSRSTIAKRDNTVLKDQCQHALFHFHPHALAMARKLRSVHALYAGDAIAKISGQLGK